MTNYQICTRCIMDSTDSEIIFDSQGICNHCLEYDVLNEIYGYKPGYSDVELQKIIKKIKLDEKDKEYDCVLGLSGGVDSSYLAYLSNKHGLRILAVHVDAGWNSEVAVQNIQNICKKLDIDLHTIVIDWQVMKELQRAYMYTGLPNLDIPQDHAFLAAVYQYAQKYNLRYMLNGVNLATEGILPKSWGYTAYDFRSIKSIVKKHGRTMNFKKYPHFNIFQYYILQSRVTKINLLNYVPYSKKEAISLLSKEFGWQYYGGKHFESRFTKFFQSYYLPKKYGYEKKRAHLSSLIVGGEMTRDEAIIQMEDNSGYKIQEMQEDRDYILKKLDIPIEDWEMILAQEPQKETNYSSNRAMIEKLLVLKRFTQKRKI